MTPKRSPSSLPVHPAAAVWPMFSEDELRRLADSIAEIGLLEPIVRWCDPDTGELVLLDGRNRFAACALANVDPVFVDYDGDPVTFVAARNANRRHMTTGQRAMAVAMMLVDAGRRRNGRWMRGSVPADTDGDIPGSRDISKGWEWAMSQAGVVLDWAPELAPLVVAGLDWQDPNAEKPEQYRTCTLDGAYREAKVREARSAEEDSAVQALPDDLRILVSSDVMTLEEATEAADLRCRIAKLDPDLAERVESLGMAIDSAEASMVERLANQQESMTALTRALRVIVAQAEYPDGASPLAMHGYHTIDPLPDPELKLLLRLTATIREDAP